MLHIKAQPWRCWERRQTGTAAVRCALCAAGAGLMAREIRPITVNGNSGDLTELMYRERGDFPDRMRQNLCQLHIQQIINSYNTPRTEKLRTKEQ